MRKRIRRIAEQIINDSFPLLKGKRIFYLTFYLRFYAFSIWIPPFTRIITLSTRTKKFDEYVLTGILAHELCHQERYIGMGAWRYLKFIISYLFSPRIQKEEERATDLLTIRKGYGRQLYELTLMTCSDEKHKKIIDNYLTPGEIIAAARDSGKWDDIEEPVNLM